MTVFHLILVQCARASVTETRTSLPSRTRTTKRWTRRRRRRRQRRSRRRRLADDVPGGSQFDEDGLCEGAATEDGAATVCCKFTVFLDVIRLRIAL